MRILQVVHDFLPNHLAGVEIYTDVISRQLMAEHAVSILCSEVVPDAPNYSLRRGRHGQIKLFELVNNHSFESFDETYIHPEIDRRLSEVLDEVRPDVIHIQHLLNLSLNLVAEARRRGIPVVMTLHDHWLTCANGGQRFHRELGRCETLDAARCGSCVAQLHGLQQGNGRMSSSFATLESHQRLPLIDHQPVESDAPEPSYIYKDHYVFEGAMHPTWVAHPPARIVFRPTVSAGTVFVTAIGMHPDTFDRAGGAVRFVVMVNGEERLSQVLDPKRHHGDRTPRQLRVPLEAGELELELRTEVALENGAAYCTAGWIDAHLEIPVQQGIGRRLVAESRRLATWPERRGQRLKIKRRWKAVRRMAQDVDLFVSPSRYLRDQFIHFGFDPDKVLYSDYGFVTDGHEVRTDLPDFGRRFTFIGSLVRHKGLHVLLEAFQALPPEIELNICGSLDYAPSYSAALQAQCDHPGVRFLRQIPNDGIPAMLAETDCLVVPSIWTENSPLTIHEAFLSGVPVVASRLGGHEDLLAGGGGLLYDADDPKDLARQLMRLHEEKGLLRELASGIPEVKPIDCHAQELVGIYRSLLAGKRPVRGNSSPELVQASPAAEHLP